MGARGIVRVAAWQALLAAILAGALLAQGTGGTASGQADEPLISNLELVGYSDLGGRGFHAAVWGYRNFAYVGGSGRGNVGSELCPGRGVTVVDIADPSRPDVVGSVAQRIGTSAEDVHVLGVDSALFRGDLLATGLQRCSGDPAAGGLSLWDVTDPRAPAELGFFGTGRGSGGVHELWVFRRESQTIALLAVPFSESLDPENQGDVRIVDISDPRAPIQLGHWGLARGLGIGPRQGLGRDSQNYAHSVRASPDGRIAYVSYWDAGVVMLDISDLGNPRYIGRTAYAPGEEGNAHSAVPAKGGRVIVQADEDVYTRNEGLLVDVGGSRETLEASYGAFRALLPSGEGVPGQSVYIGLGCPRGSADDPTSGAELSAADLAGRVALIDRGECTFVAKVLRAQQAGAMGVVIVNQLPGVSSLEGDLTDVRIPAAMIGRESGDRLKGALVRGESVVIRLSSEAVRYDDWGYLRFWDVGDPANPVPLATFATEHARAGEGQGRSEASWYTVHQPVVQGDRLYASWYGDGVRVLDIADPTRPREIGSFVPPRGATRPDVPVVHPERPFVWGVYVRGDLILASDVHTGLYILRDPAR